jgi:hypothetical protein
MGIIEFNKIISQKIGAFFPNTKFDIYSHYIDLVKSKICTCGGGGGDYIGHWRRKKMQVCGG